MTTHTFFSTVARLALAAACVISSASCGGELLRTGRSPVFLSVVSLSAVGGAPGARLLSDVRTGTQQAPTYLDDLGIVVIRVDAKNQTVGLATTPLNAVTLNRYRVNYARADGRNEPGRDVPFGFDGAVSLTIQPGSTGSVNFQLVRQQAKQEIPLRNLANQGGVVFLNTIAEITFYGRDQNGNEVTVIGNIDIAFGDW